MKTLLIRDLAHRYPGGFELRVPALDFSGICGVYGPNGAGKTTLFRCIAGLIKPARGTYSLDGQALDGNHSLVGYCPESDYFLPGLSLREGLTLYSWAKTGTSDAWKAHEGTLEALGLGPYVDTAFAACSTGTRKKAQIVASLVGEPPVLLWDEPHNGVDMASNEVVNQVLGDLKSQGRIIIMSSHLAMILDQWADSFFRVEAGRIEQTEGVRL